MEFANYTSKNHIWTTNNINNKKEHFDLWAPYFLESFLKATHWCFMLSRYTYVKIIRIKIIPFLSVNHKSEIKFHELQDRADDFESH